DDLLALSRVSRERMQLREVAVEPIVREAISEAMTAIGHRTVEFEVGDLGEARADPSLLRQLYANLIGNAVKFTAHARPARVTMGGEPAARGVYCVKDTGAGFDMRRAGQLFSAFPRLHSADESPGTGIGLAIVARVVARHDGRVWAEAEPGRGAV